MASWVNKLGDTIIMPNTVCLLLCMSYFYVGYANMRHAQLCYAAFST